MVVVVSSSSSSSASSSSSGGNLRKQGCRRGPVLYIVSEQCILTSVSHSHARRCGWRGALHGGRCCTPPYTPRLASLGGAVHGGHRTAAEAAAPAEALRPDPAPPPLAHAVGGPLRHGCTHHSPPHRSPSSSPSPLTTHRSPLTFHPTPHPTAHPKPTPTPTSRRRTASRAAASTRRRSASECKVASRRMRGWRGQGERGVRE